MRLIDADALKQRMSTLISITTSPKQKALVGRAIFIVNNMPTIDAAPVVRCKNCWKLGYDNCPMDDYFDSHPKEPDFFCAAGEPEEMRPRSACGPDYCEIDE